MSRGKKRIMAESSLASNCVSVSVVPEHDNDGSSVAGNRKVVSLLDFAQLSYATCEHSFSLLNTFGDQ